MKKLNIRSKSWGKANISWSVVIEELLHAAEELGHKTIFQSTNGTLGMKYWDYSRSVQDELEQRDFIRTGMPFDIDLTYTVPKNFPDRFLKNSKKKMAIYAYESSIMPSEWKEYYKLVDYMLPPSQYVADMMIKNGCPSDKIKVVPHGVDLKIFNQDVKPIDFKSEKSVKFLCVAEPHYRKQLDRLLNLYCETFTSEDDVSLILKTKIFKNQQEVNLKKEFEVDLRPIIAKLKSKFGSKMPEIKIISKRLSNIAGLYAACDVFALMTASEGWGMPFLEALAVGIPVIAPKHGGQLQFLNEENSILTECGTRKAKPYEQYWGGHPNAVVGDPDESSFSQAMKATYREQMALKGKIQTTDLNQIKKKYSSMKINALATANKLTWKNAMQQIIDLTERSDGV